MMAFRGLGISELSQETYYIPIRSFHCGTLSAAIWYALKLFSAEATVSHLLMNRQHNSARSSDGKRHGPEVSRALSGLGTRGLCKRCSSILISRVRTRVNATSTPQPSELIQAVGTLPCLLSCLLTTVPGS